MISRSDQEPLFSIVWEGRAVGVNERYVNRRYALTEKYKKFKEDFALCARAQNTTRGIDYRVSVDWFFQISPSRDFDSLFKPIADAIQFSGILANDKWIRGRGTYLVTDKGKGEPDLIIVTGYRADTEEQ